MKLFFESLIEAISRQGLKDVLSDIPGGKFIYGVCEQTLKIYREKANQQKIRIEMQAIAVAQFRETHEQALGIVREEIALGRLVATEPEIVQLTNYMAAIPEAVRQSWKRKDDPTGRTVPLNFALATPDDVLKLLPPRPPRFQAGNPLPHRPGWLLEKLLGLGGFGEVWLARNKTVKHKVGAVKFAFDQQARDLIHESALIGRITEVMQEQPHDGIVPLIDACIESGLDTPWLMYEYVPGGTLADWIHGLAGLPTAERLDQVHSALKQLADAVNYCHAQNPPIVHRDLKPANVLLDPKTNKLRITDFGIGSIAAAQAVRDEHQGTMTRGGRLLTYLRGSHTLDYASPQQKSGSDPDPQDDVHALGVIAYQLLTTQMMQGAGTDFEEDLKDAEVPEPMIRLIKDCVASKPERRLKSATDLLSRLNSKSTEPVARASSKGALKPTPTPSTKPETIVPLIAEKVVESVPAKPVKKLGTGGKAGEQSTILLPGGVPLKMAWCPPGKFLMGSPKSEDGRYDDETQHEVILSKGFWIGVHPVTQRQWQSISGTNPSHFKGNDLPVDSVSWKDCEEFCQKIAKETGVAFEMPTEAQWEYACRGGTTTPFYWGHELNGTQANCDGNFPIGTTSKGPYLQKTTPVGSYAEKFPHPWGLTDVHGNVWEWCRDWYRADYEKLGTTDPYNDCQTDYRSLRGGSWGNRARGCRSAYRCRFEPTLLSRSFGFRLSSPGSA